VAILGHGSHSHTCAEPERLGGRGRGWGSGPTPARRQPRRRPTLQVGVDRRRKPRAAPSWSFARDPEYSAGPGRAGGFLGPSMRRPTADRVHAPPRPPPSSGEEHDRERCSRRPTRASQGGHSLRSGQDPRARRSPLPARASPGIQEVFAARLCADACGEQRKPRWSFARSCIPRTTSISSVSETDPQRANPGRQTLLATTHSAANTRPEAATSTRSPISPQCRWWGEVPRSPLSRNTRCHFRPIGERCRIS
jgi:hypothetical protein